MLLLESSAKDHYYLSRPLPHRSPPAAPKMSGLRPLTLIAASPASLAEQPASLAALAMRALGPDQQRSHSVFVLPLGTFSDDYLLSSLDVYATKGLHSKQPKSCLSLGFA